MASKKPERNRLESRRQGGRTHSRDRLRDTVPLTGCMGEMEAPLVQHLLMGHQSISVGFKLHLNSKNLSLQSSYLSYKKQSTQIYFDELSTTALFKPFLQRVLLASQL